MKRLDLISILGLAMCLFAISFSFTSCDDDNDGLKTRVTVLEGLISDIKSQLSNAITIGATITNYTQATNGTWTFTLSNGDTLNVGGSAGGGSSVTVSQGDGYFIITVEGEEFVIATGAVVNSLVYCPTYTDPVVEIESVDGTEVCFLATPSISSSDLANASLSIADAREVATRAGSEIFKVRDAVIEDDLIKVVIRPWEATGGKTYTVALKLELSGTAISSNYFYVHVADDVVVTTEDLVTPVFTIEATQSGDYWTATIPDGDGDVPNFLGSFDFNDLVSLPDVSGTITFELAPQSEQNADVSNHYEVLSNSLNSDGTWVSAGRPGTNGGDEGILMYIRDEDGITKAKIFWKVVDPFADIDFRDYCNLSGNFEAELYGRDGRYVATGVNELNIPKILQNWEDDIPIRHSGDEWFEAYEDYMVEIPDGTIAYNDGSGKLVLGSAGEKYVTTGCRGLFWYFRGFEVVVPETVTGDDGYYTDESGSYSGGEGFGWDKWGSSNVEDYTNDPAAFYATMLPEGSEFAITLDESTGVLTTPAEYTGYGMRLAFMVGYEYAYGVKPMCAPSGDQFGMLFINRRAAGDDATMPSISR